jgi:hypothetical protein
MTAVLVDVCATQLRHAAGFSTARVQRNKME